MHWGSMQHWTQCEYQRVGCAERRLLEAEDLYEANASFVSTGVSERESGDMLKRKNMSRLMEG